MDNIHAALLLPQLSRLEKNLKKRERLASIYKQHLQECHEIFPANNQVGRLSCTTSISRLGESQPERSDCHGTPRVRYRSRGELSCDSPSLLLPRELRF